MQSFRKMETNRLIIASSRAPHVSILEHVVLKHVYVVTYKYETCTLDDILVQVDETLQQKKVDSIAILAHCSETEIFVCFTGSKVLNMQTVKSDLSIREFFSHLVRKHLTITKGSRLDFLNARPATHPNGNLITQELGSLVNVPVGMSKDMFGTDVQVSMFINSKSIRQLGELYFDIETLKKRLQVEGTSIADKRLDGYEKIRTVGKGAFGTAVLYRKIADDTMVVIKEVNMIDLTASERQMALNEVQVLSALDHPNIISYLGSFERDGVLMIEMEYADGGTLAQMLSQRDRRLGEREILLLFRQIVEAIRYMHDHNILHRDLKTANVFLTKDSKIKVGDFGISKMMTTKAQAQTVLGTPYYISPEMCEGKQYDQKSDIWALGCILYEMACLQRTFEGSNLPALVNKIMKGHFQPIPGGYSSGFRQLVHDLLQKEPVFRPTAAEILDLKIPKLLDSLVKDDGGEWFLEQDGSLPNINSVTNRTTKPQRSVLYDFKTFEYAVSMTPIQLPPRSKITDVAVSNTHIVAVTTEMLVYTWGEGKKGQLGHGEAETWRQQPECVEALKGKSINRVGAGDGYSVFVSDSGMLMTCGDGTFGCLGHGDWNNSVRPRLVEKLLSVDVAVVSCGPHHVAVLSIDNELYTWGRGDGGRLGLGNEEDCCSPMKVTVPGDCVIRTVKCGGDSTVIITTDGVMYACGRNTYNKLGLSEKRGLLSMNFKAEIDKVLVLTKVKGITSKVADVSLGLTHTAVLTESGHIFTFGRNAEGQLGRGSLKVVGGGPAIVKSMADKVVTMVQCGPTYTVCGSIENAVYFWGTRYNTFNNQDPAMKFSNAEVSGVWSQSRASYKFSELHNSNGLQYTNIMNVPSVQNMPMEVILEPQEVLALYASPNQITKGETVSLAGLYPLRYSIMILVDTTAPLARIPAQGSVAAEDLKSRKPDNGTKDLRNKGNSDNSEEGVEFDSIGLVPEWIRAELAQSEAEWKGFTSSQLKPNK